MALVKCRECGNEVSTGAASCPRCGVAGPAGTGTLLVRRSKKFVNGAIPVKVEVDGIDQGNLRMGGEVSLPLPPGQYRVNLYARGKSGGAHVSVRSGTTTTCEVTLTAMGGVRAAVG